MLFLSQAQTNHTDIAMPTYHWILDFFLSVCPIFLSLCLLFQLSLCPVLASPSGPVRSCFSSHIYILMCIFPIQLICDLIIVCPTKIPTFQKKPSPGLF